MLPWLVPKPTYDLAEIQALIARGLYRITAYAMDGAFELGFDDQDICDCVARLDASHFYKTMAAEKMPGLMQDVYRVTYQQQPVYVKLQITDRAVVISFKRDTSA